MSLMSEDLYNAPHSFWYADLVSKLASFSVIHHYHHSLTENI